MIIAIDGPAGSGKSTVARQVAHRLAIPYIDTGAMYRALTWLGMAEDIPLEDSQALGLRARSMSLEFQPGVDDVNRVLVDGRDVTKETRSPRISQKVSMVAAHREVREALTLRQRDLIRGGDGVLEGRDTGTVVCPGADVKIYLTASVAERARRRREQLLEDGVHMKQHVLERDIALRDSKDSARESAPLAKASDAVELDTTHMTLEEVVQEVCRIVEERRGGA